MPASPPRPRAGHLARMVEANLLAARAQGRNRFYRLASPEVAHAIELLMALAGTRAPPASKAAAWRRDPDLRFCRTCYDHLAGQVGIAVTDSLTRHGHLEPKGPRDWQLTSSGELFCDRLGVDLDTAPPGEHAPLRAPVPRLERAPAAHLGRAGRRHRRHVLQARLGRAPAPQPHRAPHRFRPPRARQPFRRDGLVTSRAGLHQADYKILMLRRPEGPSRSMGYTHCAWLPSFETRAYGALLRMRWCE